MSFRMTHDCGCTQEGTTMVRCPSHSGGHGPSVISVRDHSGEVCATCVQFDPGAFSASDCSLDCDRPDPNSEDGCAWWEER